MAITTALETAKFEAELRKLFKFNPDAEAFDHWHSIMVQKIGEALDKQGLASDGITYGRLAKIIAIYIKTVYIAANPNSALTRVAHPPIDSILLRNVKAEEKKKANGVSYPVGLGVYWSKFCKLQYQTAVDYLREVNGNTGDKAFWEIEAFWKAAEPKSKKH